MRSAVARKPEPAARDLNAEKAIAALQRQLRSLQENRAGALKVIDRDPGMHELIDRLDVEIAAVQAQLRKLRGTTPSEELAELEGKITGAEDELRQLNEQKSAAVVAKIQRDPEGVARLKRIDAQIGETVGRVGVLREAQVKLRQRIAADRADDSRKAAEEKPLRIAQLHRERASLAYMLTTTAHALPALLRAIEANGAALGDLLEDQGARNFLSVAAFRRRANNAFARAFAINPNAPLTQNNSLFGLGSSAVGQQSRWTLAEWEQPGLDDLAPFYATEAEAEDARERLELRGCATVIVPLHGAFTLVRFEHVFGDERTAKRAATGSAAPMTVVAHDGGFVLIPKRFAGEAA